MIAVKSKNQQGGGGGGRDGSNSHVDLLMS